MKNIEFFLKVFCIAMLLCISFMTRAQQLSLSQVRAAIPALEQLAYQLHTESKIPGMAIAVVYQGKTVYLKGFGVREAGTNKAVDADTVFQIASMSKPIASTILARLVGEKVVAWDDRVMDLNPSFHMHDAWVTKHVTLKDMFAHRSGLPASAGDQLEEMGYTRAEILRRLRYLKLDNQFRSQYAYTNFGLTAAAIAATQSAKMPWSKLAAEKLYKPAGMHSTSSRFADVVAAKNRAVLHVLIDGKWIAKHTRNADAQAPAGGVSSTARDLARWMQLQLGYGALDGKVIVDKQALAATHQPVIVTPKAPGVGDQSSFYALGWSVKYDAKGRLILDHSGAFTSGASTNVTLLPSEGLGITVITNAAPIGVPEALARSFIDLVYEEKNSKNWAQLFKSLFNQMTAGLLANQIDYSKQPIQPKNALPLKAYVGTYYNDYFGHVHIVQQEQSLFLQLEPDTTRYVLTHYNGDTFTYKPKDEWVNDIDGFLDGVHFK